MNSKSKRVDPICDVDLRFSTSFGFKDGISNPAVIGFDKTPAPGPDPVRPGILLLGRDGDSNQATRDPWMVDGSFLVFRFLFQLVPEFDKFLQENPVKVPGLSPEEGSELMGARLVGRWKSGKCEGRICEGYA